MAAGRASRAATRVAKGGLTAAATRSGAGGAPTSVAECGLIAAGRGSANRAPAGITEGPLRRLLCQCWRKG